MSLIEGVGDEVLFFFFAAIVIMAFMVLAWKSTDVPETPLSLPVLTFTISQREVPAASGLVEEDDGASHPPEEHEILSAPNTVVTSELQTTASSAIQEEISDETIQEVHPTTSEEAASEKSSELRKRKTDAFPAQSEAIITVRLMYMDDTHRVVESPLSTTIGDFKKTHFKNELNANKVVKLIFNGQVLNEESCKLSQVGLDNNSVIHCLIHQPRPVNAATGSHPVIASTSPGPTPRQSTENTFQRQPGQQSAAEAGIDIGGLLVPLFGVLLGLVWYCRIAYASYFTAAATTGLVGLSGLCIFSVLVIWYPEPEAP